MTVDEVILKLKDRMAQKSSSIRANFLRYCKDRKGKLRPKEFRKVRCLKCGRYLLHSHQVSTIFILLSVNAQIKNTKFCQTLSLRYTIINQTTKNMQIFGTVMFARVLFKCCVYYCLPYWVSKKLPTVYETLSCMQRLLKCYALRTCYYACALLWHKYQALNHAQLQDTVSSTLMIRL